VGIHLLLPEVRISTLFVRGRIEAIYLFVGKMLLSSYSFDSGLQITDYRLRLSLVSLSCWISFLLNPQPPSLRVSLLRFYLLVLVLCYVQPSKMNKRTKEKKQAWMDFSLDLPEDGWMNVNSMTTAICMCMRESPFV